MPCHNRFTDRALFMDTVHNNGNLFLSALLDWDNNEPVNLLQTRNYGMQGLSQLPRDYRVTGKW
jgi:hypothetical protein